MTPTPEQLRLLTLAHRVLVREDLSGDPIALDVWLNAVLDELELAEWRALGATDHDAVPRPRGAAVARSA